MKKNIKWRGLYAVALISVSALFLSACGDQKNEQAGAAKNASAAAASAPSPSAGAVVNRDFVIVGVDPESTPMAFWDAKTRIIVGYDIDMAKEGLKRAGLKYEFRPIDWNQKEKDLLEDKNIDLIWSSMTVTEDRKRIFAFSTPYVQNRQAIMVRADSNIQNKADLNGKKIAVNSGSIGAELAKRLDGSVTPAKVQEFAQRIDIFSAVLDGQVDAAVTDGLVASYYSLNSPGKFRILKDSLQEEDIAVGVRPSDTELLEKINKALADMQADGTAQLIYRRWFGDASQ